MSKKYEIEKVSARSIRRLNFPTEMFRRKSTVADINLHDTLSPSLSLYLSLSTFHTHKSSNSVLKHEQIELFNKGPEEETDNGSYQSAWHSLSLFVPISIFIYLSHAHKSSNSLLKYRMNWIVQQRSWGGNRQWQLSICLALSPSLALSLPISPYIYYCLSLTRTDHRTRFWIMKKIELFNRGPEEETDNGSYQSAWYSLPLCLPLPISPYIYLSHAQIIELGFESWKKLNCSTEVLRRKPIVAVISLHGTLSPSLSLYLSLSIYHTHRSSNSDLNHEKNWIVQQRSWGGNRPWQLSICMAPSCQAGIMFKKEGKKLKKSKY